MSFPVRGNGKTGINSVLRAGVDENDIVEQLSQGNKMSFDHKAKRPGVYCPVPMP